jgi:hypothetical protein
VFRDGKDACCDLVGCGTVLSGTWLPLFRRVVLLSSSGWDPTEVCLVEEIYDYESYKLQHYRRQEEQL